MLSMQAEENKRETVEMMVCLLVILSSVVTFITKAFQALYSVSLSSTVA